MTTLITGAAGFIGMHVAAALLARGERVIGIDNFTPYYSLDLKRARVAHLAARYGDLFAFKDVDFGDAGALDAALTDVAIDRIVHLGAQPGVRYSLENPAAYIHSNVAGHVNILELARHRTIAHLVYASSSSVYGMRADTPFRVADRADAPISLYAATKRADELISETYAHLFRIPQTGLRFFTVYGPWGRPDMAVWQFTESCLAGRTVRIFNHGDMRRDFTYVTDLVRAIRLLMDAVPGDAPIGPEDSLSPVAPFRVVNIGNGAPVELLDFIAAIESATGKQAIRQMLPMQPGDVPATWADTTLLSRLTGYAPQTQVPQGIAEYVDWFRSYYL